MADTSCFLFIKQFHGDQRDTLRNPDAPDKNYGQLKIELDCYYAIQNSLYPAFKIDTTIIGVIVARKRKVDESISTELLQPFFEALYSKFSKTDPQKVFKRNALTIDEVYNKYNSRFDLPILNDQIYRKGVYLTFNEFKNNQP